MERGRSVGLCVAVCTAFVTAAAGADVTLDIGPGRALVREIRAQRFRAGEQEILLEVLPPEADLSSLVYHCPLMPVDMIEWMPARAAEATGRHVVEWRPDTGIVRRDPAAIPGAESCVLRVRSPAAGLRDVHLYYLLDRMDWRVQYSATVRTAPEQETAAIDLTAYAHIENGTSRHYSNALVRLIGSGRRAAEPSHVGFVMVPEAHPLHGLLEREPPEPDAYRYRVPGRLDIRPHTGAQAPLIAASRRRARKVFLMRSVDFPLSMLKTKRPLKRAIAVDNTEQNGLGMRLPAGPVDIVLSGRPVRSDAALYIEHTEPGGRLTMNLGRAEYVSGYRRLTAYSGPEAGAYELTYEIVADNRLPYAVPVEVDEQPPVNLKWDLVQCSHQYIRREQRLLFDWTVGAGETARITYRIKVYRPEL